MNTVISAFATTTILASCAPVALAQAETQTTGTASALGEFEPRSIQENSTATSEMATPETSRRFVSDDSRVIIIRTEPLLELNKKTELVIESQQVEPDTVRTDRLNGGDEVRLQLQTDL
jgi:hypothetical protein